MPYKISLLFIIKWFISYKFKRFYHIKVIFFFTVFGALVSDLVMFAGLVGLSISLNGGVAKSAVAPQPAVVFNRFKLHPSAHRPVGVNG